MSSAGTARDRGVDGWAIGTDRRGCNFATEETVEGRQIGSMKHGTFSGRQCTPLRFSVVPAWQTASQKSGEERGIEKRALLPCLNHGTPAQSLSHFMSISILQGSSWLTPVEHASDSSAKMFRSATLSQFAYLMTVVSKRIKSGHGTDGLSKNDTLIVTAYFGVVGREVRGGTESPSGTVWRDRLRGTHRCTELNPWYYQCLPEASGDLN
ncbi:hypothetical protein C8F04DRAFT_1227461 [Mycena alexandri]|uniref:Uncharacterized protein n=1 Tax=Mycena alexandri TaxID=1745969 RepID=A0AAD6TJ85_9AGAR|nr:hypothetical protein C8F04DRAFT_1227461 [Mycena alexandri]